MSERIALPFASSAAATKNAIDEGIFIRFLNKGLIAGAHSLGYVSCASKKGNTPVGARTHAFDFSCRKKCLDCRCENWQSLKELKVTKKNHRQKNLQLQ